MVASAFGLVGAKNSKHENLLKSNISVDAPLGTPDTYSTSFGTNEVIANIYGAGLMEINPSGNAATLHSGGQGTATFSLQNDIDAVSDMFLEDKTSNLGITKIRCFNL